MKKISPLIILMVAHFSIYSLHANDAIGYDSTQLTNLLEEYQSAINKSDYRFIVDHTPPKVFKAIASRASQNELIFYKTLMNELQKQATALSRHNLKYDYDKIKCGNLNDNTKYLLAPIRYQIIDDNKTDITIMTELLGMRLEEEWYFVRVDDSYFMKFWRHHYPELDKIKFSPPMAYRTNEEISPR